MISLLKDSGDLVVAAGLIAIVLILLFLSRIGLVNKQSLPYVGGGLLALFGLFLWTRGRRSKAWAEAEAERARLEAEQAKADAEGARVRSRVAAFTETRAALERHNEAMEKLIVANAARGRKEREEIMQLQGEDLHAMADEAMARALREGGGR